MSVHRDLYKDLALLYMSDNSMVISANLMKLKIFSDKSLLNFVKSF